MQIRPGESIIAGKIASLDFPLVWLVFTQPFIRWAESLNKVTQSKGGEMVILWLSDNISPLHCSIVCPRDIFPLL